MSKNTFSTAEKLFLRELERHGTLNTFQLRDLGFMNPSKMIFDLKAKGLTFKTTQKSATGNTGRLHPRIAHYSFGGNK